MLIIILSDKLAGGMMYRGDGSNELLLFHNLKGAFVPFHVR